MAESLEDRGYRIVHQEDPVVVSYDGVESQIRPARVVAEKTFDGVARSFEAETVEGLEESIEGFEQHFRSVRGELNPDGSIDEREIESVITREDTDGESTSANVEETTRHLSVEREGEDGEIEQRNERDAIKDSGEYKHGYEEDGSTFGERNLAQRDDADRERLADQDRNLNPVEVHNVDDDRDPDVEAKRDVLAEVHRDETEPEGPGTEPEEGVDMDDLDDINELEGPEVRDLDEDGGETAADSDTPAEEPASSTPSAATSAEEPCDDGSDA
jgi:hypothetical protein